MLFRTVVLVAALAGFAAQAAPARLTEAQVRGFVARQERAWNAGDLAGFFPLFTADATFTDQARSKDGRLVVYGTSTVVQARTQAHRLFGKSKVRETDVVRAVRIAPDGRSARVAAVAQSQITTAGKTRRFCAETDQTLVLTPQGLRSKGQIDTVVTCH